MSHGAATITLKDVPQIVSAKPLELPKSARGVLIIFIVIGLTSLCAGVLSESPREAWMSFHVNFTFWFIVAAASTCFSAVLHICNAQWARPIRRIFESANTFFLWSVLPLLVLYIFGRDYLFLWSHQDMPGRGVWLNPHFVYFRDMLGVLVLAYLGRKIVSLSLRRDIGVVRSGLTGVDSKTVARWSDARFDRYVEGWGADVQEELEKTHVSMSRFSPIVVMVYAVVLTLVTFDQIMSVDPMWYSTLFGAHVFMSGVYLAMAWVAIAVALARVLHPLFLTKIQRSTLWDLGKLLFGFGIFWAYLFWSHYLTIWYGNLPEETGWVITRMREAPWHNFAWLVFGLSFIIPFLLGLSRDVKQIPVLLFATGVIVSCGIWLQQYLLFVPTLFPNQIPFGILDVGITLGFLGAFLLCAASFLSKVPLMPFGDLYKE